METGAGSRRLKIALGLSLALNLVVAGIVAGAAVRGFGHPPPPMVRDLGFGPFARALSPADREALMQAYREATPDMRDTMRAEVGALLAALRADPFDAAALQAALSAQDARARERLELGQRLLDERLLSFAPAERQAFADRLQEALTHGPGRDGPRGKDASGRD